jgi:hypothetical protein
MKPPPGSDQFDWVAHAEAVAADIFGEPNAEMSRPPDDVRFGSHGSVAINYTTGVWYDFENERGGGIKELIRVYKQITDHDAAIAYAKLCQRNFENGGGQTAASNRRDNLTNPIGLRPSRSFNKSCRRIHRTSAPVCRRRLAVNGKNNHRKRTKF